MTHVSKKCPCLPEIHECKDIFVSWPQGKVIDGTVGDRYLRLRLSGDTWSEGNPTLDIVDFKTANIPYVDQIVYKTLDDWNVALETNNTDRNICLVLLVICIQLKAV